MKVFASLTTLCLLLTIGAMPAHAMGCPDEATVTTPDGNLFLYMGDDGALELWEQTNIPAGLQRAPCDDGNGRLIPPDTQLV